MPKFDLETVRRAASGRCCEILSHLCGLTEDQLDPTRHQPCPRPACSGTDRFRAFDDVDVTGGLICNQCGKFSDIFASVGWLLNLSFPDSLERVAEYLQVEPRKRRKAKADPAKDLQWLEWASELAVVFCAKNPGVTEAAVVAAGGRMAKYKRQFTVIAFPIIGESLDTSKPVGWVILNATGNKLPKWDKHGDIVDHVKTKITFGSEPGLLGVHAIERLKVSGLVDACWKVEGVTDLLALMEAIPESLRDRHVAVTNSNGAKQNLGWMAGRVAGVPVNVVHDCDEPGQVGAAKACKEIAGQGGLPKNVVLPYEIKKDHGKDLRDWLNEGGDYAGLRVLAENAEFVSASHSDSATGLPEVELPGGERKISAAATDFAVLLAEKRIYFVRGGVPVRLIRDENRTPRLRPVEPAEMASDIELVARPVVSKTANNDQEFVESNCNAAMANLMLSSRAFYQALPGIRVLSPCPLLIERDGELIQVTDFDEASGVYAYGQPVDHVPIAAAKSLLHGIISEFRFGSEADHSRALAAMITPALVLGGLLSGRAPVDLGEADESQSGKGYRNKITAAIYCHQVMAISQSTGSVGSLEESFDRSLIDGKNFIAIDNVRGRINSPKIESFLTEDSYYARCAYAPDTEINPHRVCVMFTSNKADLTIDLANRCSCVRILKQPEGYQFQTYAEGDLLSHIRANQPRYLGAVFAVIRAWYAAGKPRTSETRHDFRAWAQTLDWIVQNIFGEPPLMDGHRETQRRMTNPAMGWLREVMLAVIRQSKLTDWLIAAELIDLMEVEGVEVPGLKGGSLEDDATRKTVLQQVGRKLKRCFGDEGRIELDGYIVEREVFYDSESRERVRYRVVLGEPADNPADSPLMRPLVNSRESSDPANDFLNTHACARTHTHARAHAQEQTTEGISGISGIPKNISGAISGHQGAHQRETGHEGAECPKCGCKTFKDVPIHNGASARRDCAQCRHTIGFVKWQYEENQGHAERGARVG